MKNAALLLSLAGLTACGGSESTATFSLMDAPPPGVTAVRVMIAAMQVHIAKSDGPDMSDPNDGSIDDDDKWVSLSVNRTIDLVQHQGETAAEVLGELPLPDGKLTQIRLVIDTGMPANNVATFNGTDCNLDVEKVAKKGVKINHPFKAFETQVAQHHQVLVDFDLEQSLKEKGSCFELEPKLKLVKVKSE